MPETITIKDRQATPLERESLRESESATRKQAARKRKRNPVRYHSDRQTPRHPRAGSTDSTGITETQS